MVTYILGISGSGTDSSAVLLKNGKLAAAIEEERFSRIKHDGAIVPKRAIKKILEMQKISLEDISCIAVGWDYFKYRGKSSPMKKLYGSLTKQYPKKASSKETLESEKRIIANFQPKVMLKALEKNYQELGIKKHPEVVFVRHHLAHAASAYYPSGFKDRTLILTIDGSGEGESTVVWVGKGKDIKEIERFIFPHSIGWIYSSITEYLGFKPYSQEGHVMGLAPYGKPQNKKEWVLLKKIESVFNKLLYANEDGSYVVNPDFLWYGEHTFGKRFTDEFVKEMGKFVSPRKNWEEIKREHQILAYVLQFRLEKCVMGLIKRYLKQYPRIENLALAGGVAFNCKVNGEIVKSNLVKKIFIQPASGDAGAALGAALIVWKNKFGGNPHFKMRHAYIGSFYSNQEIKKTLEKFNIGYRYCSKKEILDFTTKMLINNEPVAWFQGRMEWGPRALGNRSILINITDSEGNDRANKIKGRDWWRPSAISLTEESASKILKMKNTSTAPFMIISFDVKKEHLPKIIAGLHKADKTTRVQTVSKTTNPLFWRLLKNLEKQIGVPGILNTSFNKQEPIVESPEDALTNFARMDGLNNLVIGNFIVQKVEKPL